MAVIDKVTQLLNSESFLSEITPVYASNIIMTQAATSAVLVISIHLYSFQWKKMNSSQCGLFFQTLLTAFFCIILSNYFVD
jgi:hypothetical protein